MAINNLVFNGNKPENVVVNIGGEEKAVDTVIFAQSPNLIRLPYDFQSTHTENPFTLNGVTFTVNDDGSITANGTNELSSTWALTIRTSLPIQVTTGTYLVYGVTGGSYTTYGLNCSLYKGTTGSDYYFRYKNVYDDNRPINSEGAPLLVEVTDTTVRLLIQLTIRANSTLDNVTFTPMFVKSDKLLPFKKYSREVVWSKTSTSDETTSDEVVDDITVLNDEGIEEETTLNKVTE